MEAKRRFQNDLWRVHEEEIPSSITCYDDQQMSSQDSLQLRHLLLLRDSLSKPLSPEPQGQRGPGAPSSGSAGPPGGRLSLEDFRSTLKAVMGSDHWTSTLDKLLNEMDAACDGRIGWEELCTHITQQHRERADATQARDSGLTSQPILRHCLHNKQEPVTRVVAVSRPPPLRYVTVSKGGTLTVWSSRLHILKVVELSGDIYEGESTRKFRSWTTDAVYMPNVHKIAVATMSRDIHFFDVSTSLCFEEFLLSGLSHIPTSLCYWCNAKAPGERSLLMWGDEKGSVSLMWFLQPNKGLFETSFSDQSGPQRVFMQAIGAHGSLVSYQHISKIHQEPINGIMFESQSELIITSSESPCSSLVIVDANLRRKRYTWKIDKGVKCFDFCPSLSLLVTAGLDRCVSVWNRYVTGRPITALHGHQATVLGVALHHPLGKIFSYSKDAVLKIWDLQSQLCVRTVPLRFPCLKAGVAPEHGSFPLLMQRGPAQVLLLTCREYVALLRLRSQSPETGPAPLSRALYSPRLKQVVTAFADSTLVVWDVETGAKRLEVKNAHGQEDLTAMTLDGGQRRLITGAANGSIKIWNLLNGHILHKLEAVSNTDVTGVVCYQNNQLLAVGWSQHIAQYNIINPNDVCVRADVSWKSGRLHTADVLALDLCPSLGMVATGSADGEIIIWTLDTQRPLVRLHRPQPGIVVPPVDRLLFLQRRAQHGQWRTRALLLSSQTGHVYAWSVCGPTYCYGQFYVPDDDGESVLGMGTDQDNSLLVTGDTTGCIHVWDISQYALRLGDGPGTERPALLRSWRAHEGALGNVEVLEFSSQLFLLSASVDRTVRIWTRDGGNVGTFGQELQWDLNDPTTYQSNRASLSHATAEAQVEEEEEEKTEKSQSQENTNKLDSKAVGQSSGEITSVKRNLNDSSYQQQRGLRPEDLHLYQPTPEQEIPAESPRSTDRPAAPRQTKFQAGHRAVLELQRKTRARQERRLLFGDIDTKKLSRVGTDCTPFQGLRIVELKDLEDVPSRPRVLSGLLAYSSATDLSSPLLSSDNSISEGDSDAWEPAEMPDN